MAQAKGIKEVGYVDARNPYGTQIIDVEDPKSPKVLAELTMPAYSAAFLWMVDITDKKHPQPISTFQDEGMPDAPQPRMTGCHQPCEIVTGTEIPAAWFTYGLRIIDISSPHALKEVAYYLPDVPPGSDRVQSNDVTVDDCGLMSLLDRVRGLHILERT